MRTLLIIVLSVVSLGCIAQGFGEIQSNENIINTTLTQDVIDQYMEKDTSNVSVVYCNIVGTGNLFKTKVKIEIDFGQKQNYWKRDWLLDKNGQAIIFNTMVDAVNYMAEYGWHLHSTMLLSHGNQLVYHFVMEKKIKTK
jgi:hypothetical protein